MKKTRKKYSKVDLSIITLTIMSHYRNTPYLLVCEIVIKNLHMQYIISCVRPDCAQLQNIIEKICRDASKNKWLINLYINITLIKLRLKQTVKRACKFMSKLILWKCMAKKFRIAMKINHLAYIKQLSLHTFRGQITIDDGNLQHTLNHDRYGGRWTRVAYDQNKTCQ